jgi:hypothetical protein
LHHNQQLIIQAVIMKHAHGIHILLELLAVACLVSRLGEMHDVLFYVGYVIMRGWLVRGEFIDLASPCIK